MFNLKKTFLFVCLLFVSFSAYGDELNVVNSGIAQYVNKTTLQDINISFVCEGNWKIILTPLNQYFMNTLNPEKIIYINRLTVKDDKENYIENLQPSRSVVVAQGVNSGQTSINRVLKIINFDADYPGDYIGDLKFTLVTDKGELDRIYTLRFNQPVIQNLKSDEQQLNINVQEEDVFKKGASHYISHPETVYIESNREWKLYLYSPKTNDNFKYFFKLVSKSESIISPYDKDFQELKEDRIIIASGKATVDGVSSKLKAQAVKINYMIKSPQDDYLESGQFQRPVEYSLDE